MNHRIVCRAGQAVLALALVCGLARAEAPNTVPLLQLTPESAQVALAVPPLDATLAQAADIVKKFHPNPAEVDNFLAEIVAGAAGGADAWGAKNFKDIATKYGVNGDAPVGVFADVTRTVEKALTEYMANKERAEKAAAEKAKAAADEAAAKGEAAPEQKNKKLKIETPELTIPDLAAVLTVADQKVVQETLDSIIGDIPELYTATPKDETIGSVTVKVVGDYGYFFAGDKVVLGSIGLVKGAAARVDKPAKVSYGTDACPASAATEIVALLHGKRLAPLVDKALPAMRIDDDLRPVVTETIKQLTGVFDSDDPLVVSLGVSEKGADLQARINGATNKGLNAYVGDAQPLRLAQWLPENTLAMVSMRFNAQDKQRLADTVLPAIAAARGEQNQAQMAKTVVDQIGDEITIGIAAADQDFPAAFVMISLAKPEETKGLLQMLVPAMPGEKYEDVDIQALAVPSPIPVSIAYPGDMILVSNNVDGMKKIIDLQKSKGATKFLASLEPPLDPKVPRYSAIMVNAKLISDVLIPISSLAPVIPSNVMDVAQKLAPVLHDVRLVNEMNGDWHVNKLSVHLSEPVKSASAK